MGVVREQGIKTTVVVYASMLFSILCALYIFPLDLDLYGTLSFFLDTTALISPLAVLGAGAVSIKFFPEIRNKHGDAQSVVASSFVIILGSTLALGFLGFLFEDEIQTFFSEKSKVVDLETIMWVFIPLVLLMSIQNFLISHLTNYKKVAVPKLIQNIIRLSVPLIFLLAYLEIVTAQTGIILLISHFFLVDVLLFIYYRKKESFRFSAFRGVRTFLKRKDVLIFASFALLSSIGSNIAFRMDAFMLTSLLDASNNGIYQIGNRIGSIIAVPMAAMLSIVGPLISDAMSKKDIEASGALYKRSSEMLTVAGVFLVCGLFSVMHHLVEIMPNSDLIFKGGAIEVMVLIALARFIDMITSVNTHLITLSKYYKVNLVFFIILIIVNVVLNLVLIPELGLIGAAYATCASLFLHNLMKVIFIQQKMGIWPFSIKTIIIILVGSGVCFISSLLPVHALGPYISAFLKGTFTVVSIFSILFFFKVSKDFNDAVDIGIKRVKRYIKKA